jgi:hypothetical protein
MAVVRQADKAYQRSDVVKAIRDEIGAHDHPKVNTLEEELLHPLVEACVRAMRKLGIRVVDGE